MLEVEHAPAGEILTFSTATHAHDRWLQRTISSVGEHLGALRDRVLDAAALQRHSLVLDVNAATGLAHLGGAAPCPGRRGVGADR